MHKKSSICLLRILNTYKYLLIFMHMAYDITLPDYPHCHFIVTSRYVHDYKLRHAQLLTSTRYKLSRTVARRIVAHFFSRHALAHFSKTTGDDSAAIGHERLLFLVFIFWQTFLTLLISDYTFVLVSPNMYTYSLK